AGEGNILKGILSKTTHAVAVEINPNFISKLNDLYPAVIMERDFLLQPILQVDRVVMNPPFSKQQDIDHIYHAFKFLKPGGILVSVVSESPFYRNNKKSVEFREWLNDAEIINLE